MKNYIFGAMISFAALMASCNSDLNDIQTPAANGEPYQVNIKLAGSAKTFGKGVFTKAPDANALEGETNVSKLLAVAFDDADASNVTKSEETVDAGDKFYKLIEVAIPEASELVDDGDLSFGLGKEGDFQICFIANANEGLKSELETLLQSGTNVEDLKNYIMDYNEGTAPVQAPDSKGDGEGLLMVSPFYAVSTSFTGETAPKLTVILTRLMARLDLVNACDGINVQKITFNKRAVGTRLFNDEVLEPDAGTLETAAKEYDLSTLNSGDGLVGNSASEAENISYKGEIYTYSQFGTSTSGEADSQDERPSIVIEYKMPSVNGGADTYSYTLLFVNGDASTVKPLKANNLYTLKMSNSNNNVEFTLSVADWNTGDVLEVGGGSIAAGVTGNVVLESTKVSDVPAWTGGETENVTAQ